MPVTFLFDGSLKGQFVSCVTAANLHGFSERETYSALADGICVGTASRNYCGEWEVESLGGVVYRPTTAGICIATTSPDYSRPVMVRALESDGM